MADEEHTFETAQWVTQPAGAPNTSLTPKEWAKQVVLATTLGSASGVGITLNASRLKGSLDADKIAIVQEALRVLELTQKYITHESGSNIFYIDATHMLAAMAGTDTPCRSR